jgi:deoxyribonuclease-4
MKWVGAHVSAGGGVQNAPLNAKEIGARAFALFTKNQRQWEARPYDSKTIDEFRRNLEAAGYRAEQVLPHDTYLINLGNPDRAKRKRSLDAFIDELNRCRQLGLGLLNTHPGSHLGRLSEEKGLKLVAESINRALDKTRDVTVVLENTAGQGANLGSRFEHLAALIEQVEDRERIGVCLDTCHAFGAGYDLRTRKAYDRTMRQFGKIVGFARLRGVHLNDSAVELGSNKDRHRNLGDGEIGLDAFRFIMRDRRFDEIPMILETTDDARWPDEIEMLYGFAK